MIAVRHTTDGTVSPLLTQKLDWVLLGLEASRGISEGPAENVDSEIGVNAALRESKTAR